MNHAKETRELNFEDEDTSSGGQKNGMGYDSVEYEEMTFNPGNKVRKLLLTLKLLIIASKRS